MTRYNGRAPELVAKGVRRRSEAVARGFNSKLDKPGSLRAQFYINEHAFARLRQIAIDRGLSLGSAIRELVTEALLARDSSEEALQEVQRRYEIARPGKRNQRLIEMQQANLRALGAAR
jgi:hypothetical protein